MREDPIWQAFRETGDPVYYLLYKAAAAAMSKNIEPGDQASRAGN